MNASGTIGQEAARDFHEHSQRWTNNYDVGQIISSKAVRCIDDRIHMDQDYPYLEETRKVWLQTLTVPQVAALVLRYFRADAQLGQSLAEHFSEVHLAFCYNKREIKMRCMTQFREVVENHVHVYGILSNSDHAALTLILEKKMPLNGVITAKYREHKHVNPHNVDDASWTMGVCDASLFLPSQYGTTATVTRCGFRGPQRHLLSPRETQSIWVVSHN